ncbi:MAG: hypothetical protein ABSA13_16095 [Beijerinckiaceae bacterium]|jgi:hypothetical protein
MVSARFQERAALRNPFQLRAALAADRINSSMPKKTAVFRGAEKQLTASCN